MSIASEITRISGNVADAYTAANAKGATMPTTQNSDNLATTIATIPTGTTPTGSISITNNGTYDVTDKATAVVNVPTTAPAYYIEKAVDANGKLIGGSTVMNFNGITDISDYGLANAYYGNTNIVGAIDMSDLTTVSGNYACSSTFRYDYGITSVNLSSLTTVSGMFACQYMFESCANIISVNLSGLTTITGPWACANMFGGCMSLTSVSLPVLTILSGDYCCYSMFNGCRGLTSVSVPAVKTMTGSSACANMFGSCTSLTSLSFPALTSTSFGSYTNQFNLMLTEVTGCTVHFPSNLQSVIGSWAAVVGGFGGTNTTVLFDLPATES